MWLSILLLLFYREKNVMDQMFEKKYVEFGLDILDFADFPMYLLYLGISTL